MQTISLEIPTTTFAALGESPDEFISEMRIAAAVNGMNSANFRKAKPPKSPDFRARLLLTRFRVSRSRRFRLPKKN